MAKTKKKTAHGDPLLRDAWVLCAYSPRYLEGLWLVPLARMPAFARQVVAPLHDDWCNARAMARWAERVVRPWRRYWRLGRDHDLDTLAGHADRHRPALMCRFGPSFSDRERGGGWAAVTAPGDFSLAYFHGRELLRPDFWRRQAYVARLRGLL